MGTGGGVIRTSHTYTTTSAAHCQAQVPPCKTGDIQGKGCIFTKGKLALFIFSCTEARRQHIPGCVIVILSESLCYRRDLIQWWCH